jgi:hypothetical protein
LQVVQLRLHYLEYGGEQLGGDVTLERQHNIVAFHFVVKIVYIQHISTLVGEQR